MLSASQAFTILFVMLGPLRLLGPFAQRTRGLGDDQVQKVAWWTFVAATVAMLVGSLIARSLLERWQVSVGALRLTGGIIFFLVAIRQVLEQYQPAQGVTPEPLPAAPFAAACRLVFPTVVTPYGIAAVVALLAASQTMERTFTILGLVLAVMLLDFVAMSLVRRILVGFAVVVLQLLGAVLAVLQVALSVQFIVDGLQTLGILSK